MQTRTQGIDAHCDTRESPLFKSLVSLREALFGARLAKTLHFPKLADMVG